MFNMNKDYQVFFMVDTEPSLVWQQTTLPIFLA